MAKSNYTAAELHAAKKEEADKKSLSRFNIVREHTSAQSKELDCKVRIVRLKYRKKDEESGEQVLTGEETVRIFPVDLDKGFTYFKKKADQITDDQLKKRFGLTRMSIQEDCNDKTSDLCTFVGNLELFTDDGSYQVGGTFKYFGTGETVTLKSGSWICPFIAWRDFWRQWLAKYPGSEVKGDKLEEYSSQNAPK